MCGQEQGANQHETAWLKSKIGGLSAKIGLYERDG